MLARLRSFGVVLVGMAWAFGFNVCARCAEALTGFRRRRATLWIDPR